MRLGVAESTVDLGHVRDLFLEYGASLDFDLCFQGFDAELAALPGAYGPPGGRLFLVSADGKLAGGVGLRPLQADISEMKRLYVRAEFQGLGLGRRLAEATIEAAREIGYRCMRLDTIANMTAANALYRSLGFMEIPPYYDNPLRGVVYFELRL
ncbi:MAG: GNAT family N-acetyltransferase [Proteobacteria bacterium]|nr:GNAT family N-acetyltransferase [Pseudomonadota bacterium]